MYPNTYLSLFPPFPRDDQVFVAMPFADEFEARWSHVIAMGIEDAGLKPHRVKEARVSDSILTEILGGIARARLVLADISTGSGSPMRNGNVMYELGIAHACRQPSEVLIFRSDHERLLFDIASVRVRDYDPDNDPIAARLAIGQAVSDALREVELQRSLTVLHIAERIGPNARQILRIVVQLGGTVVVKNHTNMGELLVASVEGPAHEKLCELGVLRGSLTERPTLGTYYELTQLGDDVVEQIGLKQK